MKILLTPALTLIMIVLLNAASASASDDKKKVSTATATYEMIQLDLLQKQTEDINFETTKSLTEAVKEKLLVDEVKNCFEESLQKAEPESSLK